MGFLKAAFSTLYAEDGEQKKGRTPAKVHYGGSINLEAARNVQPALKHSWPQKNEPAIPSLHMVRLGSRYSEKRADFAQVGHSNLDGGFPLIQFELWHLVAVSTMLVDVLRGGSKWMKAKKQEREAGHHVRRRLALQSVFEEATMSVYLDGDLGHCRAKWMDKSTYMLRMNVQRALGIN